MEAQNNREQKDSPRRHIFTRMVPTAVLVFLLFFTFFPRFGNPVSNLRRLGQGSDTHLATGRSPAAQTVATGLQQLQASGELRSYLPAQGSTAPQTLVWDGAGRLLTITAGNTVDLSSLAGATSAVDLTSYLKNTNSQSLGLSGSALTITGGNTINLAPINTDNQTVSLTGSNLTISGGNTVNLASINTDVLAGLSCSAGQLAQWNGSVWACASPAASSDAQTLSLAADNLTILNGNSVSLAGYLDNTDSQSLSLAGNTLSLVNGGSVSLAAYLDNTDVLASLSCSAGQLPQWNGTAWACLTPSAGTDSQNLTWNAGTHVLTISNGNNVDLGSLLDNTDVLASLSCTSSQVAKWNGTAWACAADADSQSISKTGNTLSISGNASTVDLASYLDNTDAQTLSLAGSTLTITGGNSLNLAPINTDSQNLSLSGTTLNISGGTGVDIASINTDILAGLSCSNAQVAKWNGSAWACAADTDTNTDAQTLSLSSNNLSILNGNSVSLAGYLDNTDSQALSYNTGTQVLSISGNANTIDLSGLMDNTDAQSIGKSGNTLSISGNASTVDLSGYLDNTDVLAGLSCANTQVAKWNSTSSAWVCANDTVLTEAQVDAYANNNGYLTSEVDGSTTNEIQDLSLSGNTLSLSGDATTVDLSAYVNTDVLAGLSCSDGQLAKWNSTSSLWECAADTDTTYTAGTGISISGSNVISSTLGTSISTSELDNASVTFAKLASNSCANGEVIKFNGSAWVCGTDNDTVLTEANVEAYIFDGDNTGTLSSGTLALGSLSYTGTLGDAQINDALTISSSGSVADGALSSTVTKLGQTIESGEITDATITGTDLASATIMFSNIAQNGCSSNQVMKWNGTAWACAADATGGTVNSFETITTSAGTSPVADSSTDTLTLSAGSGVIITGDGTTDTIVIASTLGTDITGAEIVDGTIVSADILDGTIANADLANSSVTVTAGTGLTGGGTVALGGTVTLNLANDFGASIDSSEITNGTILFTDLGQNSCANDQVIKWNTTAWTCGTDIDTVLTEAQVDAYANNNGYLTSEVDGSTTNELQNIFQTIATPDSNNPVADSTTDTLTLANGSGITITSNNATDTITIAATLGTDITGSEIVDGTVANADLTNSSVTVTAGTGLSGGGAVSLGGTITLSASLGTDISSVEIVDGTIVADDIAGATITNAKLANSSLTVTAGNGLTTGGSVSLGGTTTLNIGAGNGITVNADDITVKTLTAADALSSTTSSGSGIEVLSTGIGLLQGCADTQILKWDETSDVWACAADAGLTSEVDGVIGNEVTDATASGGLTRSGSGTSGAPYTLGIAAGGVTNAMLANSGLTVTAGTGLSGGGSVSLGGTVTLNSTLGTDITSGEIVDGTIAADDLGADSVTGVKILDGAVALAKLATDSVNSSKIVDGSVANADLANSSVTVTAGNGLVTGGSVSLGGTVTLDIGAGNGITVNANDITVKAAASADALSATTSSGSGLEVLASGVTLLQGCANGEILKWNETTDVWACAADDNLTEATVESYIFDGDNTGTLSSGTLALGSLSYTGVLTDANVSDTLTIGATSTVSDSALSSNVSKLGSSIESSEITDATIVAADVAADTLDFAEFKDAMSLDATTTIAAGANNFNINLDSTGDFTVQDAGVAVLTVNDNGTLLFKNTADSASSFVVQDAGSLPMFTIDTSANAVQVGTLVDDAADVLLVLDGVSGAIDPTGINGGIYYNTTSQRFRCYENNTWMDCLAGYGRNVSLKDAATAASAIATNLAANTLNCVSDPNYRVMTNLKGMTKLRLQGRLGGTIATTTTIRLQYHTGGNVAIATGDAGWTTLATSAGSHTTGTMFYTAEAAIPAAAQINDVLVRACIFSGDGTRDPTLTQAQINVYP